MAGPQYDFDKIDSLAKKWGTEWDEKSTKALGHIRSGKLGPDAFSDATAAKAFGAVYTDAHAVYLATIEGVQKDLADFQAKLKQAAQTMRDKDGNAAEVMQTLAARWTSDEGFHSEQEKSRKQDEIAQQDAKDGQEPAGSDTQQTSTTETGTDDTAPDTATDGAGDSVYGDDGAGTPPPDDEDEDTESYASNQNPYGNNAPQY